MILLYTNKIISKCRNCNNVLNFQFNNFINNPPWIFIQTNESEIFVHELSKQLDNLDNLDNKKNLDNHFRSIFYINKEYFL